LTDAAAAVARHLAALGVAPGDRVALVAPYGPRWVAAFLGVLTAGAVAVPLDPRITAPDLASRLHEVRATVALFGADTEELVREAVRHGGDGTRAVALRTAGAPPAEPPTVPRRSADPAVIVYTSGSTGTAKPVTMSWANLVYQVETVTQRVTAPDSVLVSVLPAHHSFELMIGCLCPLYAGARIHYPGSMLPTDLVAAVAEQRATGLVVVPLLLVALRRRIDADLASATRASRAWVRMVARLPLRLRRFGLPSLHARFGGRLRHFFVGGAPLDPDLAGYFERLGIRVCQGYGMTEASPVIAVNSLTENRPGSVGRPLPDTEVRIVRGEILARGPGVTPGYWARPDLTGQAVDPHGWLHTGDRGFLDKHGYLFVAGRVKNVIVLPSGENVQPEDVEGVLDRSALIGAGCVLGLPGPHGEQVVAVVAPGTRADADPPDAAEWDRALTREVRTLSARLAPHQRPSRILVWPHDLPRTASGKVSRERVRELLESGEMPA
jgi:long-chain acyl-CoA synthetase